jgi:8-oxo-dGTP pyrophosphatase MutT (NUDIX family)
MEPGMPDGPLLELRAPAAVRRQAAALPLIGSGADARVVLVTSRETRRWVIPKGWIEPPEPPFRTAMREAFEEAGLSGEAEQEPLGSYSYPKRLARGVVLACQVQVFRLHVAHQLPDWPERQERERRLFTPEDAAALVQEEGLAALLRGLSPG